MHSACLANQRCPYMALANQRCPDMALANQRCPGMALANQRCPDMAALSVPSSSCCSLAQNWGNWSTTNQGHTPLSCLTHLESSGQIWQGSNL